MRLPGDGVRRLTFYGLLLAVALVLSYVESLIPFFFGVPGMKLGLPNLAVVLLIMLEDPRAAAMINLLRIVLAGFLFGSLFGILFSLAGALFSFAAMVIADRTGKFGVSGVSILGGVMHNVGQLLVAVFIVKTAGILYDTPFLVIAGALTGALIGLMAGLMLAPLKRILAGDDRKE